MISFQPTEDEVAFVEMAQKFAEDTLRPSMREVETNGIIPDSIVNELRSLGLLTMEESEAVGGLALPMTTQVQIQRALSFGDLATMQGMPGLNDGASFSRTQQDMNGFETLLDSDHTVAYISAQDEQPFSTLQLHEHLLTGTSLPVRTAKIATHFLVALKDENEVVQLLLIPNHYQFCEVTGKSYLGLEASQIGKVTFNKMTVLDEHVVASGEKAEMIIREAEMRIYVLQAAKQVGLMEAACEYATEYAATRKAFGQEIAKFQAVSFRIAKMLMELQVTNNFVLEAANAMDEGKSTVYQKAWKTIHQAHKAVRYVTDSAVQLLGGHGFVQEFPVEKWMRDAQAQVMLYGSERAFLHNYGQCLIDIETKEVTG